MRLRELFRGSSALTLSALLHASLFAALVPALVSEKAPEVRPRLIELELREKPRPHPPQNAGAASGTHSARAEEGLTGVVRPAKHVAQKVTSKPPRRSVPTPSPARSTPSAAARPAEKRVAQAAPSRASTSRPVGGAAKVLPTMAPNPKVPPEGKTARPTERVTGSERGSAEASPQPKLPPDGEKREARQDRERVERRELAQEVPGTADERRPAQRESNALEEAVAGARGKRAQEDSRPAAETSLRSAEASERPDPVRAEEPSTRAAREGHIAEAGGELALETRGSPSAVKARSSDLGEQAAATHERGVRRPEREPPREVPPAEAGPAIALRDEPSPARDDRPREAREALRAREKTASRREAVALVLADEASTNVSEASPPHEPEATRVESARDEKLRAVQEELRRVQALLERLANDTGPTAQAQVAEAIVSLTVAEQKLQDLQAEAMQGAAQPIVVAPEGAGAGEVAGEASLEGDADLRMLVQIRVNEVARMVGPLAVRRAGRSGVAVVRVRIDARGYVDEVQFLQSTGSQALDDEVDVILHLGEPYVGVRGWLQLAVDFRKPSS